MGQHNILYLTASDLETLGVNDTAAAMADVETAFRLFASGDVLTPHKVAMEWPAKKYGAQNRINAMPGYVGGTIDMAGVKWIGSSLSNYQYGLPRASALIILNDPVTKLPLCIMDGAAISAMRTGASGGLGVKYLAKEDTQSIMVVGAGVQGKTQMKSAFCARPAARQLYVNDVIAEKAEAFAAEMTAELGVPVTAVDEPQKVAAQCDVLITTTIADKPVVHGSWIKPGATYIHMGGPECTFHVLRMADKRVFDNWDSLLHRGGTSPALMYETGELHDEDIYGNLGEIILGRKAGRERDDEFIFYGACGMGITDIAIAARLYRKALETHVGIELPYC